MHYNIERIMCSVACIIIIIIIIINSIVIITNQIFCFFERTSDIYSDTINHSFL